MERHDQERAMTEARGWWQRLGSPRISNADVRAFRDWLDAPLNDAAWSELERLEAILDQRHQGG